MKSFSRLIQHAIEAAQNADVDTARKRLREAVGLSVSIKGGLTPKERELIQLVERRLRHFDKDNCLSAERGGIGDEPSKPADLYPFCICLNTTRKELEKVEQLFQLWSVLWSAKAKASTVGDLVIFLDNADERDAKTVMQLAENFQLYRMYRTIKVCSANIPEKLNFYKRIADGSLDISKFAYGYKSGPNLQFFSILRSPEIQKYKFVLITETDCFPVSENWAERIYCEASARYPFWVLGSPFRGRSKIGPDIALHINGAAVYAPRSQDFGILTTRWESALTELVVEYPTIAYDCALELYYNKQVSAQNWQMLTSDMIGEYQHYRRMFIASDLIVNLAGEPERAGLGRYQFGELRQAFPSIELVHGDYFYPEAKTFVNECYRSIDRSEEN